MLLIITLCAAVASGVPTKACDRIAQPVDQCGNEASLMFQTEVMLAQTNLYDGTQKIHIECVSNEK